MLDMNINREEMYVSLSICLLSPLNMKMKSSMNFLDPSQLLVTYNKKKEVFSLQLKLVLNSLWS
jgi:hypothetical protein